MLRSSSQLCAFVALILLSNGVQGFRVVDNVLSAQDIQQLQHNKVCREKQRDFFHVDANMFDKLQLPMPPTGESFQIQARSIESTTRSHQDRHWDSGKVVDDTVAFVFLNSNPDASFVYGGTTVPVEAGTMVQFAGSEPHYTRVNSGSVQLAGPLDVTTLQPVGADTIDPPIELPPDLVLNLTIALFAIIGVIGLAITVVF